MRQSDINIDFQSGALLACVEIGKLLTSTLNLNEILELILFKASSLIQARNWSLLLVDEASQELRFEVVVGIDKEAVKDIPIRVGAGIAGVVAQTGEPLVLPDAQNDARFNREVDKKTGFTTRSIICLPLKIHGKVLGVLEIVNVSNLDAYRTRYLPILSILTDYAAIAIQNSQYTAQIEELSITDEYTGLRNARYLHQILGDIMAQVDREGQPLAVVFVDIDNFKQVVDSHGHLCGSQVLKEIGQTISANLDGDDILIKYGGDEYVILLPGRNKMQAVDILKKILDSIRSSIYLQTEKEPVKLTASFGIAMYPEDAKIKKELLLLADNSMYRIKKTSKNGIGTT